MAVGTRIRGHIEPGAMPALHRLVGTPVLTWVINRLFGGSLSDCNSGFRALRKDSIARWGAESAGMEFASELLTNALEAGSKIVEATFESDAIALDGLSTDRRVSRVEQTGRILRLTVSAESDSLAHQLSTMGAQSVRILDLNLEDIFLNAVDPARSAADIMERA